MMKKLFYLCIPFLMHFNNTPIVENANVKTPQSQENQCDSPRILKVLEIDSDKALLDWKGPIRDYYQVEYGENGFTKGKGTVSSSNISELFVEGLAPNTAYDFYVRGNCGGQQFSKWVGPYTFVTDKQMNSEQKYYAEQ
jgi:hypothetical protein